MTQSRRSSCQRSGNDTTSTEGPGFVSGSQYRHPRRRQTHANLVGPLIGAAVVFLFRLAINVVSRAAGAVIFEVSVRRKHPGIMTYEEKPEYARVV